MRAADVMTTEVVTVDANATVRAVAALLSERGISGVPVINSDNQVIGIVSEGDLIHRAEIGTERTAKKKRSWWLDSLAADVAPDYVKSHGRTIGDVMTRDVITVTEATELADVATLMETKGIKRVPVEKDGKLVGIISRASLVRALAAAESAPPVTSANEEEAIRTRVRDEMIRKRLLEELGKMEWMNMWAADVIVKNQVVHLWFCDDEPPATRRAMQIAAENTDGVRSVEEHIVPGATMPPF
jgi:CBS domain-containing protein